MKGLFFLTLLLSSFIPPVIAFGAAGQAERILYYYAYLAEQLTVTDPAERNIAVGLRQGAGFNEFLEHIWAPRAVYVKPDTPDQSTQPKPKTDGTPDQSTQPKPDTDGTNQPKPGTDDTAQPKPDTDGTTQPKPDTDGTPDQSTQPKPDTPGTPDQSTQPKPDTPGTPDQSTQPKPDTAGTPDQSTQPKPDTAGTPDQSTKPKPDPAGTPDQSTQPKPDTDGTNQPKPDTPAKPDQSTEPKPDKPDTPDQATQPKPDTPGVPSTSENRVIDEEASDLVRPKFTILKEHDVFEDQEIKPFMEKIGTAKYSSTRKPPTGNIDPSRLYKGATSFEDALGKIAGSIGDLANRPLPSDKASQARIKTIIDKGRTAAQVVFDIRTRENDKNRKKTLATQLKSSYPKFRPSNDIKTKPGRDVIDHYSATNGWKQVDAAATLDHLKEAMDGKNPKFPDAEAKFRAALIVFAKQTTTIDHAAALRAAESAQRLSGCGMNK